MKIEDTLYWQHKKANIELLKIRRDFLAFIKPYLMPIIERLNTFAIWLAK